jgi:predicted DNA-binding transcriptional regulator YafY
MLQLVPRAPRSTDAATIEEQLAAAGMVVTRRSVQRDLEALAEVFEGLVCDRAGKPYGWSWKTNAPSLELPTMSVPTAIALDVMHASVRGVLPKTILAALAPTFQRARDVLATTPNARLARWPKKIRSVPNGVPRVPVKVGEDVFDAVCTALLEDRRLRIVYRARGAEVERERDIDPLALVERAGRFLVVAATPPAKEPKQFAVHRMSKAEVLDVKIAPVGGFDIDAFLDGGATSVRVSEEPVKLRLRVAQKVGDALRDSPLSRDQVVRAGDRDGWVEVEATVADTMELRAWVLSYAAEMVVIGPEALRDEVIGKARAIVAAYDCAASKRGA